MAKTEKKKKNRKKADFLLLLFTLMLVTFGTIMVFSASYYMALSKTGERNSYFLDELKWVGLGLVVLVVARYVDYHIYKRLSVFILGISFVLLVLVFTPMGHGSHNAYRWIEVGSITIMPGELAKPAAIIFTAAFLSEKPKRIKSFFEGILPLLIVVLGYAALIIKQPNLSTAITVVMIIVGMMFIAGLNFMYLLVCGTLGVMGVGMLVLTHPDSHWAQRFSSFTNPFADSSASGWQVVQSLLAMGSGGIFGLGLGKSVQKNLYLPEAQNDFIFAIIGEELGFFGCMLLIILYIALIYRIIKISISASDLFGSFLAAGIGIMIGVQVILNVAVVTSSIPPTGVALPFVSYGGNALLIFMGCIGILLNISSKRVDKQEIESLDLASSNDSDRRK